MVNSFLSKHFVAFGTCYPAIGNPFPALSSSAFLISARQRRWGGFYLFLFSCLRRLLSPHFHFLSVQLAGLLINKVTFWCASFLGGWEKNGCSGGDTDFPSQEGKMKAEREPYRLGLFGQRKTEAGVGGRIWNFTPSLSVELRYGFS